MRNKKIPIEKSSALKTRKNAKSLKPSLTSTDTDQKDKTELCR